MGRPGYLSLYADERTQQIFDEFVKIKGVTKATALTEMLEIYMLCQDEELYLELKKKALGIETARNILTQRQDTHACNDYIFIKLSNSYDKRGKELNGMETIQAYIRNLKGNGLGYTWFSTESLHFGMAKKKIAYYNQLIRSGETVKLLFAVGEGINDICYAAKVLEIVSDREQLSCPGEPESVPKEFGREETARIWLKLTDIQEEHTLQAAMLKVRSTEANLKQVISNSQFHFGYVYLP